MAPLVLSLVGASALAAPVSFDFETLACAGPGLVEVASVASTGWDFAGVEPIGGFDPEFWVTCDTHVDYPGSAAAGGIFVELTPQAGGTFDLGPMTLKAAPAPCQLGVITAGALDACTLGVSPATSVQLFYVDASGTIILSQHVAPLTSAQVVTFPGELGVARIVMGGLDAGGAPASLWFDDVLFDDGQPVPELLAAKPGCPTTGPVSFGWRGATPNGPTRLLAALSLGVGTVPSGPCAGTPVGLSGVLAPAWGVSASGDAGKGFVFKTLPPVACGAWAVVVDETTCFVSLPDRIE